MSLSTISFFSYLPMSTKSLTSLNLVVTWLFLSTSQKHKLFRTFVEKNIMEPNMKIFEINLFKLRYQRFSS